ncbi:MAG TPA: 4Fe-4S single cluster domain-containing protein [Anaerolineaceae bacterium]|nr:4Fe-4S single cluster domain-containing protein [Anaerolineaceae bacterium]
MNLRLHAFEPASRVNGPGQRAVVWVQGCTLGCPGCFNPETHGRLTGSEWPVDELLTAIAARAGAIEGVTISGGEPLQQSRAVVELLTRIKETTPLSTLVFTGFSWPEVRAMPVYPSLARIVDVLLAGRYDASQRIAAGLLGSANKTVHFFTDRYTQADLDAIPEAEITISPEGEVLLSGIRPLTW